MPLRGEAAHFTNSPGSAESRRLPLDRTTSSKGERMLAVAGPQFSEDAFHSARVGKSATHLLKFHIFPCIRICHELP